MYYDSFTPRTGPAAMPSPRSRVAPYFSGRRETFNDFLEEFEARAYDCRLTDSQQVDALVHYVDPSLHETCESLNGYRSCDWHQFRKSLVHTFSTRPQVMQQKLRDFVDDSSRMRMDRQDDVFQYYQAFQHYSDPLVHSRHMSKEERNMEFWYGFHPHDRDVLWPRLLASYPSQPHDIPFHYEDIYNCAWRVFGVAYRERPSFRPWEQEFEPRSICRKYSPSLMSDPRLGPLPSFSHLFSESLSKPAPSAPEDKPDFDHESTPSIIPPPPVLSPAPVVTEPESSITPTSPSMSSLASSCTNVVPESEPESTSIILPTSPSLPPTLSPQSSCTNVIPEPEPETTPSITPPTSLASSCTNLIPKPEPTPTSTPSESIIPASAPLSELEHAALSLPQLSSTRSLAPPSFAPRCTDDIPELVSAPPSSPSIPLDLECHEEPEPEPEHSASPNLSPAAPLSSPSDSPSIPPSSCELPPVSLAQSLMLGDLESQFGPSLSPVDDVSWSALEPSLESYEVITLAPAPPEVSSPVVPSYSMQDSTSQQTTFRVTPNEVTPVTSTPPSAANAQVEHLSSHPDRSHASFPPFSTVEIYSPSHDPPSSPVHPAPLLEALLIAAPHSSPSQPPHKFVQASLSDSLEDSWIIPVPIRSRSLKICDSTTLEATLAPIPLAAPSTPLPSLLSSPRSAQLVLLPFAFVTTAVFVSALPIVSKTISTRSRKSWSKSEDLAGSQNGIIKSANTQQPRLAQPTFHPARLVFDPGGSEFGSSMTRRRLPVQADDTRPLHHHAQLCLPYHCFRRSFPLFWH